MYIFKENERIVDIMSVNTMICEECTISGASVFEDALCQANTRPKNVHFQIFSHLEMDECRT